MLDDVACSDSGLEFRIAGNDVIVHDVRHERIHVLNKSAAYILQSCDGSRSARTIADELCARTSVDLSRALADVERTIAQLRALKLLR